MARARILTISLALALLAGCGTAPGNSSSQGAAVSGCVKGAAASGATLTAPKEPKQGVMSPTGACWADIQPTPIAVVDTGTTPKGDSAEFWAAWSGSYLYIRTYAATWPLQDAANDAAGDWWESDTTEDGVLGLDTHAGNYCTVSPTDPTYPLAITTKDVLQRSGCNGMRALPPPTPMEHSSKTRSGWPHPGRA